MRIALTNDNGQIFRDFDHTEYFKVHETRDGRNASSQAVSHICGHR